jgi:hypothetical protein
VNRRLILTGGAGLALAAIGYNYFSMGSMADYDAETARQRAVLAASPDMKELVRYATLAANSHNTQPWKFVVSDSEIRIMPDTARRTPVVDPDDHHLFAGLGCATENLVLAAAAQGRGADVIFDDSDNGQIKVNLSTTTSYESELFKAIPHRQCTRSIYDGADVPADHLKRLGDAAKQDGVDVVLITDKAKREKLLEQFTAANSAQIADSAFVGELASWMRFNPYSALVNNDGLFSACSENPTIPSGLGKIIFPLTLTEGRENQKLVDQLRSSAGLAVFVSQKNDRAHWFNAGRAYQRFALQATALGIRNAFVNQPTEVVNSRGEFARTLELGERRPDLVVRFGMAPTLPMSLRRPVSGLLA